MRKRVRRILIAIGILILFIVGGLIYKNIYINSQEKSNETIVKKNVKIITSETDKDERPTKVLEDKLEFKKDLKYKKGDVIVSGITSEADAGYIRKVVNTKKKNGKYIVQTEPAYLTDVFEKAHIVKQIELTENGVEEVDYKLNDMELYQDQDKSTQYNSILKLSGKDTKSTNSTKDLNGTNDSDDSDDSNDEKADKRKRDYMFEYSFEEKDDLARISGEVGASVWIEIQIDIDKGDIVGGIAVKNKTHVKGTWGYSESTEEKSVEKEIFKKELPNYQFLVAGVPVVLTNDMIISAEAKAKLEGDIGLSYDATSEKTLGFQYNSKKNKVKEINERKENSEGLHWSTSKVSGSASASINLHLITKLYGASGMDVSAGILGKAEGEAKTTLKEGLGGYAGCLDLSIGPEIKGTLIVDVPVFAQGLNDQYLFKIKLPPFWSDHWESSADWKNDLERTETGKQNDGLKEILKQGNTYVTRYSEQNAISCPVFQFDYPSGWDIQSEEMSDGIDNPIEEKVVLVNDRGVTVTYWDCSRTLGGYSRSVVKAEISKVGDSEFVPGFPAGTNTDYSSLGSFMVAKVHLVGEMDSKLDSDYNATDSEFFAVVPASYEGEREFQGQVGFVDEFSFEYPTPYAFIAEAPDGQFTPEEEKEVIEILKSFKIAE